MSTFCFGSGDYIVTSSVGDWGSIYPSVVEHAQLHEDYGLKSAEGTALVISVQRASDEWPCLVVSQRFSPSPESGFDPAAHLVPETDVLFIGAGTCLLAYDLRSPRRLWEDVTFFGFWGWKRHGDVIIMLAELELAAWTLDGRKLWSVDVEPVWSYEVRNGLIYLDVEGRESVFSLHFGPAQTGAE